MIKIISIFFIFSFLKAEVDFGPYNQIIINECKKNDPENLCPKTLTDLNFLQINETFNKKIEKLNLKNTADLIIINSPKYFIENFYCLAINQQIITLEKFDLFTFAYAVRGFSFTNKKNLNFTNWIKSKKGNTCELELNKLNLESKVISNLQKYTLVLNPITFYENGPNSNYNTILEKTINHELLHLYFSENKMQKIVLKKWKKLSATQQQIFQKEHPSYNFKNKEILLREFFSYSLENDIEQLSHY